LPGNPDVLINNKRAVFLQGCFWHKCPIHYKKPSSNKHYWLKKIDRNAKRDATNKIILKSQGFKVVSFWEHDISSSLSECIRRMAGEK
ncbi:very short patch repair endonuclease, partial [Candidatus Woesearchaeota archaeon]|nr:very short patch repair endonuclease [Candidatus Woesearchaeota archaeon]